MTRILVARQLELWPEHTNFLAQSLAERDAQALRTTESTATKVLSIVGDNLDAYCRGYRWMCEAVLKEELYFRRYGKYQQTNFADVYAAIYDDPEVMKLYMDGLLLSQVFWRNHVDMAHFFEHYLSALVQGYAHLEIGPGHGLLLAQAAMDPKCGTATAWDISEASLTSTRHCLQQMNVSQPVILNQNNIYAIASDHSIFDSVVVSEVLEHLEDPLGALRGVRKLVSPRGRAFINVPCNSPAPDHIFLYSKPDNFFDQLEEVGFTIVERFVTPATGWTLERALRQNLAISCAAIVTP